MSDSLDLRELEEKSKTRKRQTRQFWSLLAIAMLATVGVGGIVFYVAIQIKTSTPGQPLLTPLMSVLLLFLLVFGLGMIGIILFVGIRNFTSEVRRQQEFNETLHQTVPGLPEWQKPPILDKSSGKITQRTIWRTAGLILGTIVAAVLLVLIIQAILGAVVPDLPPNTRSSAGLLIMYAILFLSFPVIRYISARRQHKPLPSLWRDFLTAGLWLGVFFILFQGDKWLDWMRAIAGSRLAGFGIVVLLILAFFGITSGVLWFPFVYVMNAFKQGNYDVALRRIEQMKRFLGPNNPSTLFLQGTVLLMAGRYEEAEALLRDSLAAGQDNMMLTDSQTVALENLGWVLLGQGRYDEAITAFENAIKTRPEGTDSYNGLAQVYLIRGNNPQRALDMADKAMENKRKRMRVDRYVWGEILANRAWALAQLGRHDEAQHMLDQAFREADHSFNASMGGLYCRAAQIKRLWGKDAEAIEDLKQAQRIDPNGASGKQASDELRKAA